MRDAFHLSRPGADPGPAGRRLVAWRELSARSIGHWRQSFAAAGEVLRVPHDEALQEAIDAAEAGAGGDRPAPFAAAQVFALARRALKPGAGRQSLGGRGGEGELLAAWLADCVLAQRLKWPFALPLLAAPLFAGAVRRAAGDGADGAEGAIVFAYAKAAARACDLSAELGRRAQKLMAAQPKLRAKGAPAALAGAARRGFPERVLQNRRANIGARRAAAVRPAGRARRGPRTDRTRDVPALRALNDGAPPQNFGRPRPRTRRPDGAGALARMDGPRRGGDLRLR